MINITCVFFGDDWVDFRQNWSGGIWEVLEEN